MTCMAPSNELFVENKFFQMNNPWMRKHYIEESSSDEEVHHHSHSALADKPLDRLKEINALLHQEAAYAQRYSEQPMTPNNRKRLFSEYNTSPDFRHAPEYQEDGRYKLTLSQFATSASEQEPLYPGDDEDVEEILMRLRHGNDYYQPKVAPSTTLPSLFFPPNHMSRPHSHFYPHHHDQFPPSPPLAPSPNKASLFHILSQEPENVNNLPHPHAHHNSHHSNPHHHMSVNNLHMRKMFFDEGIMESSDEMGLEHPKKKARRDNKPKSPLKSIIVSNDDVQEKETVAAGLCFKTHKPKVQREYYYAKLSKTIFRWTCCGSQAKTHPDA